MLLRARPVVLASSLHRYGRPIVFQQRGCAVLLCLRHGEAANAHSERGGLCLDAPLTARGELQAGKAARALKPLRPMRIVSSPATRAQQTAHIIGRALNLQVTVAGELIEIDVGSLDGKPREAVNSAAAQAPTVVVGHVASLTVGIAALCGRPERFWGRPLPHAALMQLRRVHPRWACSWPGVCS